MAIDVMRDYWDSTVADARAGRKRAVRTILRDFNGTVADRNERTWSGPFPWQFVQYLAECFTLILRNVPADKALGLRGDRGRNSLDPDLKRLRAFRICLRVLRLKATGQYETWQQALKAAAHKLGVSPSTIEKAWKSPQRKAAEINFRHKRGKKSD